MLHFLLESDCRQSHHTNRRQVEGWKKLPKVPGQLGPWGNRSIREEMFANGLQLPAGCTVASKPAVQLSTTIIQSWTSRQQREYLLTSQSS